MNDLEQQLREAGSQPQRFSAATADHSRITENLLAVHAELDAPAESRLARLLRRLGVPDLTVPLITATPALRRSWFGAVAIAVLFALSVASNNNTTGVDRIGVFLTLAPLVPLLGVALAFGKGVDPTHDLVVAAPRDTFTVFLIRSLTVLVTSALILIVGSALLPSGGAFRVAWLLPAVAISTLALALSTRFDPRQVAAGIAGAWVVLVLIVVGSTSTSVMFGPVTQALSVVCALTAGWFVFASRQRFEHAEVNP